MELSDYRDLLTCHRQGCTHCVNGGSTSRRRISSLRWRRFVFPTSFYLKVLARDRLTLTLPTIGPQEEPGGEHVGQQAVLLVVSLSVSAYRTATISWTIVSCGHAGCSDILTRIWNGFHLLLLSQEVLLSMAVRDNSLTSRLPTSLSHC